MIRDDGIACVCLELGTLCMYIENTQIKIKYHKRGAPSVSKSPYRDIKSRIYPPAEL
jgi:hypothetical protein